MEFLVGGMALLWVLVAMLIAVLPYILAIVLMYYLIKLVIVKTKQEKDQNNSHH